VEQPHRLPKLDVLIIDEAQDLSRLQWQLVEFLVERSDRTYLAGDDDQAVYTWAGADVQSFLDFQGEIKVLEQSWRVPSKVHELANMVVNRIRQRQPKTWHARDYEGEVQFYNDYEMIDITKGNWLILASANYMLNNMYGWIKSQGLLFERHGQRSISEKVLTAVVAWERLRKGEKVDAHSVQNIYKHLGTNTVKRGHKTLKTLDPERLYDMETLFQEHGLLTDAIWHEALTKISEDQRSYIIAMLRRGTRITGEPPIRLSTIHGAKGGEADNVLLLLDLSTKFANDYDKNSDDVNRLFYVGITRAKQTLHVVLPKDSRKGFRL
jgi:DNA helicase-2/ATP-dependent DNA helicase PcrA